MRVLLTVDPELPVPPVHYGGVERIVDMLARSLVDRGHHVTLMANPESTSPAALIPFPHLNSSSAVGTIANAALVARTILQSKFDIVHSHSRLAYLGPILPLNIPKLMTYHRAVTRRTVTVARAISRGTLEFSGISRAMIAPVQDVGTWHLVYNGVRIEQFDFSPKVAADAPLVFLGRIEHIKGAHIAIEVARQAGVPLVIAGNIAPDQEPYFEREVRPHLDDGLIRYIGPVDDGMKNSLLGAARAFLMPILWEEPFGLVMAEALACGTPVIGLRRGAVSEVVKDGITGFVRDGIDGLVAAVAQVDQIDRVACRRDAETAFSSKAVADGYIAAYESILSRRQRKW